MLSRRRWIINLLFLSIGARSRRARAEPEEKPWTGSKEHAIRVAVERLKAEQSEWAEQNRWNLAEFTTYVAETAESFDVSFAPANRDPHTRGGPGVTYVVSKANGEIVQRLYMK